jgi:hypothetical protein
LYDHETPLLDDLADLLYSGIAFGCLFPKTGGAFPLVRGAATGVLSLIGNLPSLPLPSSAPCQESVSCTTGLVPRVQARYFPGLVGGLLSALRGFAVSSHPPTKVVFAIPKRPPRGVSKPFLRGVIFHLRLRHATCGAVRSAFWRCVAFSRANLSRAAPAHGSLPALWNSESVCSVGVCEGWFGALGYWIPLRSHLLARARVPEKGGSIHRGFSCVRELRGWAFVAGCVASAPCAANYKKQWKASVR